MKTEEEKLYDNIMQNKEARGINISDLGEDMAVGKQVIGRYWKPRFLIDHRNGTAVEFMTLDKTLLTVKHDDILWDTLSKEKKIIDRARCLSFHFPSDIYPYKEGVAKVRWQLRPDGMYYMDDDGFGRTSDQEYNIHGFIDRSGRVLSKFRHISDKSELEEMRQEALHLLADKNPRLGMKKVKGHEFVDLGLSVKWATCNIGAKSPYDPGEYYAWSNEKKTSIRAVGYWSSEDSKSQRIDIASANWGRPWRMPSLDEFHELMEKCEWESVLDSSFILKFRSEKFRGYKITSKINGRSIFLPAGGWRDGTILKESSSRGYYWSSDGGADEEVVREHHAYIIETYYACALDFDRNNYRISRGDRDISCSIRPVWEE